MQAIASARVRIDYPLVARFVATEYGLLWEVQRGRRHMRAMLVVMPLALTIGCNQPDARIFGQLTKAPDSPDAAKWIDQYRNSRACIERWAARLSRGPDTATEASRAAIANCSGQIAFSEQLAAKEGLAPTSPIEWEHSALFIVVQARAGRCYQDA